MSDISGTVAQSSNPFEQNTHSVQNTPFEQHTKERQLGADF